MDVFFIYITAKDRDEAERIGRILVEERLAACANILGGVHSIYRWEGEVQAGEEVVLMAKTTEERVGELVARVKELHSYDCPCVVSLPIAGGNPEFLEWVREQTR